MQDGAAAGRDRVDAHHRRPHAHARHFGVEGAFVVAVIVGDVRRGAAHVEADHLAEAGEFCRFHHADHATGWARQQRILALEFLRCGQTARRHHEHQARGVRPADLRFAEGNWRRTQLLRHPLHIARQDRREIGIDHRRVAAPDQFHQWRDLVAHRNLSKTELSADLGDNLLMFGKSPRMHEDDRHGVDAISFRLFDCRNDCRAIERRLDDAVGTDAFVNLYHPLVELFGKDDLLGEDVGSGLVGDAQCIVEAFGYEQHHPVALAFQKGVCGNSGAHLDVADDAGRDRRAGLEREQIANALDGGVAVGLRILREKFPWMQGALRVAANNVGEGAAAIDPEVPFLGRHERFPRGGEMDFRAEFKTAYRRYFVTASRH